MLLHGGGDYGGAGGRVPGLAIRLLLQQGVPREEPPDCPPLPDDPIIPPEDLGILPDELPTLPILPEVRAILPDVLYCHQPSHGVPPSVATLFYFLGQRRRVKG